MENCLSSLKLKYLSRKLLVKFRARKTVFKSLDSVGVKSRKNDSRKKSVKMTVQFE